MCLKTVTKQYRGFGYKLMGQDYKGDVKGKVYGGPYYFGIWYTAEYMNLLADLGDYHRGFHIYTKRPFKNLAQDNSSLYYPEDRLYWVKVEYRGILAEGIDKLNYERRLKKIYQVDIKLPTIVSPMMRVVKVY